MNRRMGFSTRTDWDLERNAFAMLLRQRLAAGGEIADLTVSNPAACGLAPEPDPTLHPLRDAALLRYEPHPLGAPDARDAVAAYYRSHGAVVPVERLCLTSSTSEAYSFLFRLLCDSGDEVLIARPSYPLFDFIARLDHVRLVEYPLTYDDGWHIDLHSLGTAISPQTRAVIVVHPNNPTGNFASPAEREALDWLCAAHGLALIVDEVFLDFPLRTEGEPIDAESFAVRSSQALTFVLSGLSKVCGLPQMKLSWIAGTGPAEQIRPAMERLEIIADTFLSVSSTAQHALPAWLDGRSAWQQRVRERIAANLDTLDRTLAGTQADRLRVAGGWTAMLRVPRFAEGRPFAEAALLRDVLVQPGEFYGASAGHVVVSLLTPPEEWTRGLARLPLG